MFKVVRVRKWFMLMLNTQQNSNLLHSSVTPLLFILYIFIPFTLPVSHHARHRRHSRKQNTQLHEFQDKLIEWSHKRTVTPQHALLRRGMWCPKSLKMNDSGPAWHVWEGYFEEMAFGAEIWEVTQWPKGRKNILSRGHSHKADFFFQYSKFRNKPKDNHYPPKSQ